MILKLKENSLQVKDLYKLEIEELERYYKCFIEYRKKYKMIIYRSFMDRLWRGKIKVKKNKLLIIILLISSFLMISGCKSESVDTTKT